MPSFLIDFFLKKEWIIFKIGFPNLRFPINYCKANANVQFQRTIMSFYMRELEERLTIKAITVAMHFW